MRITLLGTGSADGWPNAFCTCPSCEAERCVGRTRQPSSALVDGVVLLDCGPTAPHAIGRAGGSLTGVEHVLLTHGHPDHLHPAFLLSRGWIEPGHLLQVWGPAGAVALCRPWIGPDDPVELHVLVAGDRVDLSTSVGPFVVDAYAANHSSGDGDALAEEALVLALRAPDGHRLLYATDTGPLPEPSLETMRDPFDVVLIDETFGNTGDHGTGHLDLATLPDALAALRTRDLISTRTTVVATHLSHHNPPTAALRALLQAHGVQVLDDLAVIDSQRPGGRPVLRRLILGGARSGKSTLAEHLAAEATSVTYVATGRSQADDVEWAERVARHRERRPAHWDTVETIDLVTTLAQADPGSTLLIDCLSLWLTGHLDAMGAWDRQGAGAEASVLAEVTALVDDLARAVENSRCDVIVVSNEAGMGIVPATPAGRLFRDLLGITNARIADAVDENTLVVAGRAVRLDDPDRRVAR